MIPPIRLIRQKLIAKQYDALLAMAISAKETVSYIDQFLSDPMPDDEMLDIINDIIVASKVLDDLAIHVILDDYYYDRVLSKYKNYRDEPFYKDTVIGVASVAYEYPTLAGTLDKVHSIYEVDNTDDRGSIEKWLFRAIDTLGYVPNVHCSLKADGVSVSKSFKYDDKTNEYKCYAAYTRGDLDSGLGGDMTHVFKDESFRVNNFHTPDGQFYHRIGVQYEMVVLHEFMDAMVKYKKSGYATPRSAASGMLRRLTFAKPEELNEILNMVRFIPVGFECRKPNDTSDRLRLIMDELGDMGLPFKVMDDIDKFDLLNSIHHYISQTIDMRDRFPFLIDGVVLTILGDGVTEALPRSGHINKHQVAYKFPEMSKKTYVTGLTTSSGLLGYREIMYTVNPVLLNGTNQQLGQCHSINKYNDLKLAYGDEVWLKHSGDVIPFLYIDEHCQRSGNEQIPLPEICEECDGPLIIHNSKLRCNNDKCPANILGKLENFLVEMGAKGIGPETLSALYYDSNVETIEQLLQLRVTDFLLLDGFGETSASKCEDTIQRLINTEVPVTRILGSLGIDSFREKTAKKVLGTIPLERLLDLLKVGDTEVVTAEIAKCNGISANARLYAEGLISNYYTIVWLLDYLKWLPYAERHFEKSAWFTGVRPTPEQADLIKSAGYDVKESFTKTAIPKKSTPDDVLVKGGSKISWKEEQAREKGLPVMTLDEFLAQL